MGACVCARARVHICVLVILKAETNSISFISCTTQTPVFTHPSTFSGHPHYVFIYIFKKLLSERKRV